MNHVYTLNPLSSSPGGGGGGGLHINEDGGLILEGVLFYLETMMVSVVRKELEAQVQEV